MNQEQYIDHEVRIRLKEKEFSRLESKLNFLIGLGITGIIIPVILHWLHLI